MTTVHHDGSGVPGVPILPGSPVRPLTSFVGRRHELGLVVEALTESRLVTVTGPGGMGKTRLAVEVVGTVHRDYPAGAHIVDLAPVASDDDVVPAVLYRLGLAASATVDPVDQLARFVAGRRLLIVLDNCEHLVAGCRAVVVALVAAGADVQVLATSRERLAISGERVVELRSLPTPSSGERLTLDSARRSEAVQLLEDRGTAAADSFALDEDNIDAAVAICRRLDGLPLAIELAARWLRSLAPAELLARLDDRFAMLGRGDPTARHHHRTLSAVVSWSWELCTPDEQQLWARMSVFAGGAELEAVRAVCVPDALGDVEVLDRIDALIDKSVVVAEPGRPRTRYRMLETLADFGAARLVELDDEATRARHAEYYRDLGVRGLRAFHSADQLDWMRRQAQDRANLVAAFEHLMAHSADGGRGALELASALRYLVLTGWFRGGSRPLERALDRYRVPDLFRLAGLESRIMLALHGGEREEAMRRVAEAQELAAAVGSELWTRLLDIYAVVSAELAGRLSPTSPRFQQALSRVVVADNLDHLYPLLAVHTLMLLTHGELAAADTYLEVIDRESGVRDDRRMQTYVAGLSAVRSWFAGDPAAAASAATRCFDLNRDFRDRPGMGLALSLLAGARHDLGQPRRAAMLLGAAASLGRFSGDTRRRYGPVVAARIDRAEAGARARLGEEAFAQAWAAGGALPEDDMVTGTEAADDADDADAAGATGAAGSGSGPLTGREYEIAELVSTGLTNRMIAERLSISPRTVDGHLERILAKLGQPSRAGVAAWVVSWRGAP